MDLNLSLNITQGTSASVSKSEGKLKHKLKRKKLLEIKERKKNRQAGNVNKSRSHAAQNPIFSANADRIREQKAQRKTKYEQNRLNSAVKLIESEFDSGIAVESKKISDLDNEKAKEQTIKKELPFKSLGHREFNSQSYQKRGERKGFNQDKSNSYAKKPFGTNFKKQEEQSKQADDDILKSILGMANKPSATSSNDSASRSHRSYDDEFSDGFKSERKFDKKEKRKYLSDEEYYAKKEKEMDQQLSQLTEEDRNKLKEEFNQMFSNKGPLSKIEGSGLFDNKSKPSTFKQFKDTPRESRLSSITLFKNVSEIPNVELPFLKKERKEGVFTEKSFDELEDILHPHLISCVKNKLNLTTMTTIQSEAIPKILTGNDCLIKSVTGSGKSMAILIPLIQKMQELEPKITRTDGTVAIIILPTRELVLQFYEPLSILCSAFNRIVPGYLMGGENKHSEKNRIRKGINILVCTPGRLIDHLETTKSFSFENLKYLIIDEADRLYEAGFEESVKKIVDRINEAKHDCKPQTILASATLTEGVKRLAGMLLEEAEFVDTCEVNLDANGQHLYTLPEHLKQHFCFVPAKLRILTLSGFIFKHCSYEGSAKMLVFMSTQDVVDFHHALFKNVLNPLIVKSELTQISLFKLHGSMQQSERMEIFTEFRKASNGVLLCTDVASRGVDLPHVDWVVQYSCSATLEDYVHRVGRTARIDQVGQSVLFVLPSEDNYIKLIQSKLNSNLTEEKAEKFIEPMVSLDFSPKANSKQYREQAGQLQYVYESAVAQDTLLADLAKKAYVSHTRAYASYPRVLRDILPFKQLHLGHVCKSFCLRESPRVLGMSFRPDKPKSKSASTFTSARKPNKRPLPSEYKTSEFDSGL